MRKECIKMADNTARPLKSKLRKFKYSDVEGQFTEALHNIHVRLSHEKSLQADGHIHRADAANKERGHGKGDAAYVLHMDGWPAGYMMNWTTGVKKKWRFESDDQPSEAEQRALKKFYAEKARLFAELLTKDREAAQAKAETEWKTANPAPPEHPYLKAKDVPPYGVKRSRVAGNCLLVPLRDEAGVLWNVQKILRRRQEAVPMARQGRRLFS
jgi:phage/plasmid primase-like uncharacterized protein